MFNVLAYSFNPGPSGLAYRWTFGGNDVPGANGPSLLLSSVDYTNIGPYTVSISDANGTVSANPVQLLLRPHIIDQPQNQSVPLGGAATFRVNADGAGPLTYIWLRGRRPIPGETNATLQVTNVSSSDATNYSVVVFHELPAGRISIPSSNAVLTISP